MAAIRCKLMLEGSSDTQNVIIGQASGLGTAPQKKKKIKMVRSVAAVREYGNHEIK